MITDKKIFLILFISFLLLFSCSENNNRKENHSIEHKKNKIISYSKTKKTNSVSFLLKTKDIKKQITEVTTSFLQKKNVEIFIEKPNNKFFGVYYLIKGTPKNVVGKMIIYDDVNPYIYDKNTDEFIEINLWHSGISLFNNTVEIGMSKNKLIKQLGNNFVKLDNNIIFYEDLPRKAFFKIKNDTISNIKIGVYRNNVLNSSILKYEW